VSREIPVDCVTYRWSGFCKAGKDAFRRLPFCLPIPNLFSTSRTSPDPEGMVRFLVLDLDRVCVSLLASDSPPMVDGVWSSVEIEGRLAKAGFDMLLRPSSASLSSVTPTPLVERAKLCREIFSMCIKAGDIFRRGDIPSPRTLVSNAAGRSTAEFLINQ
jgi:hypothetical protein